MKELSLNILDIAENSVKAKADLICIAITENDDTLEICITDNGIGMTREILNSVIDPFCTTRTTRKVGMGIPLFKFAAEQTGGSISIKSTHIDSDANLHGTEVKALFYKKHIDYTPLGDVISTVTTASLICLTTICCPVMTLPYIPHIMSLGVTLRSRV